ncbi:MAG TPA: hypothetical protein VNV41_05470 [Candidatus Acidoferrales bacterium]|nr:hypothetical protein [Candidatus Acidoferrales bacterium]
MKISSEHIAAVESLGYTPDEARFLYIVATFSGYFVPRQYNSFVGARWGKRSDHFVRKLESRGHATWREYPPVGGVYHLISNTLYRVIDKESLRNNRRHAPEFIRRRLVVLDFVLANQAQDYFETESDKVSYFCESLGIPKTALPAKPFVGSPRLDPTLRYFVDKFPLFVTGSSNSAESHVTFSYMDPGEASLAGLAHHLNNYKRLFSNLSDFHFLFVSNSTVHFVAAERCFARFTNRELRDGRSDEILRYFRLRRAWDEKHYGTLSSDDIEWLESAEERFRGQETERQFAAWHTRDLAGDTRTAQLEDTCRTRKFRFRTWLVSTGHTTANEL